MFLWSTFLMSCFRIWSSSISAFNSAILDLGIFFFKIFFLFWNSSDSFQPLRFLTSKSYRYSGSSLIWVLNYVRSQSFIPCFTSLGYWFSKFMIIGSITLWSLSSMYSWLVFSKCSLLTWAFCKASSSDWGLLFCNCNSSCAWDLVFKCSPGD